MSFIENNITTALTYVFLYITIILLWTPKFKKIPLWGLTLAISTVFGLISKRVDLDSIFFILFLVMLAYCLGNQKNPIWMCILSGMALFSLDYQHVSPSGELREDGKKLLGIN